MVGAGHAGCEGALAAARMGLKVLEILEDHGVTGTFFILGWVAEHYPELRITSYNVCYTKLLRIVAIKI